MKNKISIYVLAFLALLSFESFSQVQVSLGLKGGPNFAKLDVNSNVSSNYKNRTGFHGGGFFLVKISKVGIQPELIFSRQGTNFKVNAQDLNSNFDYINVPVMIKLYTVLGINLQFGPQFGFLASTGGKAVDNAGNPVDATKSLYKSSDLSAAFGVGWDLPFGLTIDGRYNLGLSKIQDNPLLDATKNQVIQVSLGYKLVKFGK
jgi:Outer membrane protein beta-barrel domain